LLVVGGDTEGDDGDGTPSKEPEASPPSSGEPRGEPESETPEPIVTPPGAPASTAAQASQIVDAEFEDVAVGEPPPPPGTSGRVVAAFVWLSARWRTLWETRLERLLAEEDTSWRADNHEIRSLICLFRAKHEELRGRSRAEHVRGSLLLVLSFIGLAATAVLVFLAWHAVKQNPDVSWHLLASSSGAILFLLVTTTQCFKAGDRFFGRAKAYADDADETRRFEAAVRLALFALRDHKDAGGAMLAVVGRLLEPKRSSVDGPLDLSAMPEFGKVVTDAVAKATEAAASTFSRR
jgi:hypothetical protein